MCCTKRVRAQERKDAVDGTGREAKWEGAGEGGDIAGSVGCMTDKANGPARALWCFMLLDRWRSLETHAMRLQSRSLHVFLCN